MKRVSYGEYEEMQASSTTPPISVIIPAYNEQSVIKDSIRSLLNLNYPEYEVIVVNDGSRDDTLEVIKDSFGLVPVQPLYRKQLSTKEVKGIYRSVRYPHLIVIDKENGGKSDALNCGINAASFPYFCSIDADSLLEQNSLLKTMRPVLEGEDNVIACGGIVRVANGCSIKNGRIIEVGLPKNRLAIFQVIEYLRGFLIGRLGFSSINNLLIISGAFGVFRKKEVLAVGGYNADIVGEDMELVLKLQRYIYDHKLNCKVLFVPDPVCWTEAPDTMRVLKSQRLRWQRGLIETMILHYGALFRPKYGKLGWLSMPYFLFVELLGPSVEFIGYIVVILGLYLGVIDLQFAILFLIVSVLFGIFLSWTSILLEEWSLRRYPKVTDLLKLVGYSVIENLWYRQVNVYWRTWAFVEYFRKRKGWGMMERKGFDQIGQDQKVEL
jgi:cellulose synthase/poly-beta-1,6-N-acetylglucosamine synthase-like glycosyltransferase